jgi:nucleoside-diphosphate-sugar epimerase
MADRPAAPVFLTGATGFIGGRLAESLHARGYRLRCLVRSQSRAARLAELGAELVVGDVADTAVMREGMQGAALAYHVAAMYRIGRVDSVAMERTNVAGTRAFIEAVRSTGVPRAVYVSSVAALGPVGDGADEAAAGYGDGSPADRGRDVAHGADAAAAGYTGPYPSEYHRTKAEAHRIAVRAQLDGLPLVIVCPGYVYGPGDTGPAHDFLLDILRHRLPGLPLSPTVFSYAYVDDVVDGLVAAGERGAAAGVYVLSGEAASTTEFARLVAREAGIRLSPLRFPGVLARLTGRLLDGVNAVTGWRFPISYESARAGASGERWVYSYRRAAEELGYRPRPLAEGLPPTVRAARGQ